MKIPLLVLLLTIVAVPAISRADDQAPSAETRLRQALRDSMLQLRDAQNQAVTLQAAQAQSDKDKADLQAKVDTLTAQLKSVSDQASADKDITSKAIEELKGQVASQTTQIDTLTASVKQWKDAADLSAKLAEEKEALRASAVMQTALLQRTVDDRETKNLALFKLGNEILTRYERFGLGDALSAKEPFVGTSRVKLENLVQDYKNKLLDQAITSAPPNPPVPPPSDALPAKSAAESAAMDKASKAKADTAAR